MEERPDRLPWPWMTTVLVGSILVIWVAMTIQGGSINATVADDGLLTNWGAALRPHLLAQREYWRLFTASFIHIGYLHLIVNGWSLWVIGRAVEVLYGPWHLLYLFAVTGIAGATASVLFGPPLVLSAGASGAIMGLLGAVVWYRVSSPQGNLVLWRPLVLTLLLNVGLGLGLYRIVDNWDHLGGFVGGVLASAALGVPLVKGLGRPRFYVGRWWRLALSTLVLTGAVAVVAGAFDLPGPSRQLIAAIDALDSGKWAEAETGLRLAVSRQPDEPGLRKDLVAAYLAQGKCAAAAVEFWQAYQLQATDPDLPPLRARITARCQ